MITATSTSGGNFTPIPAGSYVARCYSMVHMGTIDEPYMGEVKTMNKVRITWELPTETKVFKEENGEQPFVISKEFTLSMHEKANLRKVLEGWRGKGFTEEEAKSFEITKLLGVACMISVIHKTSKQGKTYAEISSISAMPKGLACPPQVNKNYEFNYDNFDVFEFEKLPDFLKAKMKTSVEYKKAMNPGEHEMNEPAPQLGNPPGANVDDLPF